MTRNGINGLFGILLGAFVLCGALWGTRDAGAQIPHDGRSHTLTTHCCDRN